MCSFILIYLYIIHYIYILHLYILIVIFTFIFFCVFLPPSWTPLNWGEPPALPPPPRSWSRSARCSTWSTCGRRACPSTPWVPAPRSPGRCLGLVPEGRRGGEIFLRDWLWGIGQSQEIERPQTNANPPNDILGEGGPRGGVLLFGRCTLWGENFQTERQPNRLPKCTFYRFSQFCSFFTPYF